MLLPFARTHRRRRRPMDSNGVFCRKKPKTHQSTKGRNAHSPVFGTQAGNALTRLRGSHIRTRRMQSEPRRKRAVSEDSIRLYQHRTGGPGASRTSTSSSPATPDPTKPAALRKAIAEGAYSNAGGPIPDGATKITAVGSDGTALIRTPTGNIGCEFSATAYAGCGVSSYMSDVPYGKDEAGPAWWIDLSAANAIPRIVSHSQPGSWEVGSHTVQTVPYGSVVHYGSYVCASESPGLTCWNTANGHGAFMRRSSTTVF